jgi:uncharacterized membrane protein YfcA
MENVLGYFFSGLIGVSLGLIGGGGSIITVPLLVYIFHIEPTVATAYSLIIVGATSLVGGVRNAVHKLVDFKIAFLFSIPSLIAIYIMRHLVLPQAPATVFFTPSFSLSKDFIVMIFFSLIMILASLRMIRKKAIEEESHESPSFNIVKILLQGIVLGVVTGIVGAGGGFLIIPALVLLAGLPMKRAVATSLIIITINSVAGFAGDRGTGIELNYSFAALVSAFAIGGVLIGTYVSRYFDGTKLRIGFGWFALAMAFIIVTKEILASMG